VLTSACLRWGIREDFAAQAGTICAPAESIKAGNTRHALLPTSAGEKPQPLRVSGSNSRADSLPTIVNETSGVGLVLRLLPKTIAFNGDAVLDLVEPGLYRKHRRRS